MGEGTGAGRGGTEVPKAVGQAIHDRWVPSDPARPSGSLHYLEREAPRLGQVSLVYCPGNWEPAWRARPLLEGLEGHALVPTYRGHGDSFTPSSGYDLEHHVGDLDTMIRAAGVEDLCLAGFSRGVGYALGFLARHPERVRGLVLMDALPIHGRPEPGYADHWISKVYRGHRIQDHWRPAAMAAMEREAREVWFPDVLPEVSIPVLILRGTSPNAEVPSDLSDAGESIYRSWLPQAEIVHLPGAGHMLLDEAPERCRELIQAFLARLQGASAYCDTAGTSSLGLRNG